MRANKGCNLIFPMRFITDGLLKHLRPRGDDDFVDRLNYYYTPTFFILAAAVVSGKQYVAKPIQCWIPPQFTRSMEEYIESYCWIQNTYWLPAYEHIPDEYVDRESRQIGYYQWVPFILLLEGFLFTLPCMWWRLANRRSGLDLNQLINSTREAQTISDRQDNWRVFTCIAQCLSDSLDLQTGLTSLKGGLMRKSCFLCPCYQIRCRRSGYYVTIAYLITKFLYAANAVGQFFLVNLFLKNDPYQLYGFRVLAELLSGKDWTKSGHFPRVTLCDFEVRSVGNLNRFTVQCALTVNVFNEKIFIFVWIWLCIMAFVSTANLVCWFFSMIFRSERLAFVYEYVATAATNGQRRQLCHTNVTATFERFLDRFLRIDGVLALRMIAIHAGDLATVEITKRLWKQYKDRQYESDHQFHNDDDQCCEETCRPLMMVGTKETLLSECTNYGRGGEDNCKATNRAD